MSKACLVVFITFIFIGCTKEEADFRLPQFEVPVIHGYFARDAAGSHMGIYGYDRPNVNLGDHSDFRQARYFFMFFPNPTHNSVGIYAKSPDESEVKKLWITRAVLRPPFDVGTVWADDKNNFIAGGAPLLQREFTGENIYLDLTDLPNGYYRIYVKINNLLLYDNLVIDRTFNPYQY
jgi:hypothetical protein